MLEVLCMVVGLITVKLTRVYYILFMELKFLIQYFRYTMIIMTSVVSSNPTRICVCQFNPNCTITHYNITAYRGETFKMSAVAVGQRFGTVPFTVQSRFILSYTKAIPQLGVFYYTQIAGQKCTYLTYSVMSANRFEIMQLLVDSFDVLDTKMIEM